MQHKTVAIVGSHIRTKMAAPWDRPLIDIWVFNESASLGWPKRVNAVFQMHHPAVWRNPMNLNDTNHLEWLKQYHPYPVYMQAHYDEVPSSVEYPLRQVVAQCMGKLRKGKARDRQIKGYFTSSVAYALALAIYQGYRRIELFGVEMESDTEYRYQRDGVFFWMGVATGKGIEVIVHPDSNFFKEPLYGYEGEASLSRRHFLERMELLSRLQKDAYARVEKATEDQRKALEAAQVVGGDVPKTAQEYFAAIKEQGTAVIDLGMFDGAIAEEEKYLKKCDAMDEAGGAHIFARQEFEITGARAREEMEKRKNAMHVQGGQAQAAWNMLHNAIKAGAPDADLEKIATAYAQAHEQYVQAAANYGFVYGAMSENVKLLDTCDELVKAAGGDKSEAAMLNALQVQNSGVEL